MSGNFKKKLYSLFGLDDSSSDVQPEGREQQPTPIQSARDPSTGRYSSVGTSRYAPGGSIYTDPSRTARVTTAGGGEYVPGAAYQGGHRVESESYGTPPRQGTGVFNTLSRQESRDTSTIPIGARTGLDAQAVQMIVFQLQSYDDAQRVVDELKSGHTVIVSTERLRTEIAQRVLDFIGGAMYALNGNHRKIARGIFIFAPENVDISGSYANMLPTDMRNSRY